MPGSETAILDPLQKILRWGLTGLGIFAFIAAVGVLLHWLTLRWKTRAEALAQQMDRGLASLHHVLGQLRSEAAEYPPDTPAPYGPIVQQLQTTIDSIEATYRSLADQTEHLSSQPCEIPARIWDRITHHYWHDPRYWWQQRGAFNNLVGQLNPPRTTTATAKSMLRDLRRQPLDTSERARELYELVDTAQHTAGLLQTSGVHGTALDATMEALKLYRKTLTALPIYLFACTESQIVRRAQPDEIAEAWSTIQALDEKIRETTDTVAAWHAAYTLAEEELRIMCERVKEATTCIQETPNTVDISDLATTWQRTTEEAETLASCYEAPSTDDLDCIDQITEITATADEVITGVTALKAQNTTLASSIAANKDVLNQIDQQLRQLAGAGRYPLDRVPMQVVLDELNRQLAVIDGASEEEARQPDHAQPAKLRTPEQLAVDLAEAEDLNRDAESLATQVATARERRRHLIELLDQQAEEPQVDWVAWANDLYQRTHPYVEANWPSGNGSTKPPAAGKPHHDADLHVRTIVQDASQLAERQTRWLPAHVDEPLIPDELEQRTAELTKVFADIDTFQDRLDRITQRFQLCQQVEEQAKSDLATVYGAVDRLDIIAADVLPPALVNENNHWTRIREQLDLGYEIELALANPGIGTVHEKAQRVDTWIAGTHKILLNWQKALAQEMDDAVATLSADLDELAAVAPLSGEPAVEQAREVAESQAARTPVRKKPAAKLLSEVLPAVLPGAPDNAPDEPVTDHAAQIAGCISEQLRALATLDQALAALSTEVITPLTGPIVLWREAEQTAESAFDTIQKLEKESAGLWPPISCDTARVKEEFDRADRIRDSLYQDGKTVPQVLETITTLTETYTTIVTMAEEREATYRAQRPTLDEILDQMEKWCTALERHRDRNSDDPAIVAAVRARLDEIEAGWTQLQVRYDQAPGLVTGEDAQRTLDDLLRQARRDLPLGPGPDVISADEVEV